MPHPRFGRVGWFLGGGGMAEGPPQLAQEIVLEKAGIKHDHALALSVGSLDSLTSPQRALQIWREHFTSHWNVYDLNPEINAVLKKVFAQIPHSPFHKHESFQELFADFRNQSHKLIQLLAFLKRTGRSIFSIPLNSDALPKELAPFLIMFLEKARACGLDLDKISSILDPAPLVRTLQREVDLKGVLDSNASLHILTRSNSGAHIFAAGPTLQAEFLAKFKAPIHDMGINSEELLFKAAMASAALDPFFAPVRINGGFYWDIGDINPFPVEYLMDAGCDTIFAFVKNYWSISPNPEANVWERFLYKLEEFPQVIFLMQYEKAYERAEREGRKLYTIVAQTPHSDASTLTTSPEAIEYSIKVETEATKKWLKDNLNITPADG